MIMKMANNAEQRMAAKISPNNTPKFFNEIIEIVIDGIATRKIKNKSIFEYILCRSLLLRI